MRPRKSRLVELAIAALLVTAGEGVARAQACCVAASGTGVARLGPGESALAGVEARGQAGYGSFDGSGRFRGASDGTHDVALEQDIFATARFFRRVQGSITLPFVETLRGAPGMAYGGGGLGDVRFAARWDLTYPDTAHPWPGVALMGGAIVPSGVPPEHAGDPLGAGATGLGTTQGWAGLALEEAWGPWLVASNSTLTMRADRDVAGITSSLPPRFAETLLGAHAWTSGIVVSLASTYAFEGDAVVAGARVPGSGRRTLQTTLGLQVPVARARILVGAFVVPPLPTVSAGDLATAGVSVAVIQPW